MYEYIYFLFNVFFIQRHTTTLSSFLPSPTGTPSHSPTATPSPLPMPEIPYLPFLELDTNISLVKFLPRSLEGSDLVVSDKKIVIGENVVTNLYVSSFYYI